MSGNTSDTHDVPGTASDTSDSASGDTAEQPDTTDAEGRPVDNPSGG